MPNIDDIVRLYRKRAGRYDFTANLYYLIGFREWAYRKQAIAALQLQPGDSVVELGCGTGLNFPLLQQAVGPDGKIIGVDLTDAMLAQARRRVEKEGWPNVELLQASAADFTFPDGIDGILSTFAFSMMPEPDRIVANGSRALATGGRWAVLDLAIPDGWLFGRLAPLFLAITRPFGIDETWMRQRPWQRIQRLLDGPCSDLYLGFAYIATNGNKEERHADAR